MVRHVLHIFILAGATIGCGSTAQRTPLSTATRTDPIEHWRELAPYCEGFPSKSACDDGDMLLFSGLLCASGEAAGCAQVRASQDEEGRFWRSPRRTHDNLGMDHSFSRDMSLGAILYLAKAHDRVAAGRWLAWIEGHRPCLLKAPGGACLIYGHHRFCDDDEDQICTLTPINWALLGRLFVVLELEPTANMQAAMKTDTELLEESAGQAPLGFALHLVAVEIYIEQLLGVEPKHLAKSLERVADRQPQNPFFAFLQGGASHDLWQTVVNLCPKQGTTPSSGSQWTWERDTEQKAWEESMGWDCLFMANLLGHGT